MMIKGQCDRSVFDFNFSLSNSSASTTDLKKVQYVFRNVDPLPLCQSHQLEACPVFGTTQVKRMPAKKAFTLFFSTNVKGFAHHMFAYII
jgi:hypothetical protein